MTRSERLEEIRKRAEAATKGPWTHALGCDADTAAGGCFARGPFLGGIGDVPSPMEWDDADRQSDVDQDFINNAREDIPWLLAEVERLESALEQLSEGHEADCRQRIRGGDARCNCSVGIAREALRMPQKICHICHAGPVPLSHDCTGRTEERPLSTYDRQKGRP